MPEQIYKHWANCTDLTIINRAKKILKSEIDSGLLNGIQYQAELQLLQLLSESE